MNGTASGAGGEDGSESGDADADAAGGDDGSSDENGTAAADGGVAESEGAAGHVTVLSSAVLLLAGVSSLMALL
jgi:hypothetical protein